VVGSFSLGLALSAALAAQPPAHLGDQFQVNTYTTNEQVVPSVGVAPDGSFVVVWESNGSPSSDTDHTSIQARRIAADGTPQGSQFQVNTETTGYQRNGRVAVDLTGTFVVVWEDRRAGRNIAAQRFAADGSPAGAQFTVNSYTTTEQYKPSVACTPSGDFVVVWHSWGSPGSDQSASSIQARRFAANGTPLGDQFQVNDYTTGVQGTPRVAADPGDGFVVVWTSMGSFGSDADNSSVQGRRFGADGSPIGGQFQVNSWTTGQQNQVDVAARPDGSFLVTWTSIGQPFDPFHNIFAQRFAPDGTALGGELLVNTYTTHDQTVSSVAATPSGFVVTWQSYGSFGPDQSGSVEAQMLDAQGNLDGGEFQVNTYSTSNQKWPSVGVAPNGVATIVWQSNGSAGTDQSATSIQGQRLDLALFRDGFESGDTSAWSGTLP
jgi:hypothetical protein